MNKGVTWVTNVITNIGIQENMHIEIETLNLLFSLLMKGLPMLITKYDNTFLNCFIMWILL